MDARGPLEARLLALERRLVHVEDEARRNQVDLAALWQEEWDAWSDRRRRGGTPAPPPPPPVTLSGTVSGCNGTTLNVASMDVLVTDSLGGTLGDTTTDSSGHYSLTVTVPSTDTITVTVTPLSGRFAVTAATISVSPGDTATRNVTLDPATGYHCVLGCLYPVYQTLTLTDPRYSLSITATWDVTFGGWLTGYTSISYPGNTFFPCGAVTTQVQYTLKAEPGLGTKAATGVNYWASAGTCQTCPSATHVKDCGASTTQSQTCPGSSTAATYQCVGSQTSMLTYTGGFSTSPYNFTFAE